MRFFGTPYRDTMSYRDSSRLPEREGNIPTADRHPTAPQRQNQCDTMSEEALLLYIQRLDFVKVELQLYLDGYPECQNALRYYREVVANLKEATDEYEMKYGPITATGTRGDAWLWCKGKWPWQIDAWR